MIPTRQSETQGGNREIATAVSEKAWLFPMFPKKLPIESVWI